MLELLQPDAFFKSFHQLRCVRDELAFTVLQVNAPVIKDCQWEEWYSHVEKDFAWSIRKMVSD